jgi:hypothetical protein
LHSLLSGGCPLSVAQVLLAGIVLELLVPPVALAQRAPGSVNLGVQVGQPAGATGKVYRAGQTAYSGLVTTDGDDFVKAYLHRLHERPLPDSLVHLYVGPGLLIGAKAIDKPTPLSEFGFSVQAGLNFYRERFEVFLQMTPFLHFLPKTTASLGGSVGLRYTLN